MFIFQEQPAPAPIPVPAPASVPMPDSRDPAPDQKLITNKDIKSLVDKLNFAELSQLYLELNLTDGEVEDAQSQARTKAKLDRAMKVFHKWQQKEGNAATKMALLQALKECELINTMQMMQQEWGITSVNKK